MSQESTTAPTVNIGTSGWNYPNWRGQFYPESLPRTQELSYMSTQFDTLEINSSFYRLQRISTYRKWGNETVDGFQFSVKGWRQVTHYSRLRDAREHVATFLASGPLALETKLGPLLWQLPPSLKFDAHVLGEFLAYLPRTMGEARALAASAPTEPPKPTAKAAPALEAAPDDQVVLHALEPRNDTFASDDALALLREHNVALVAADIADRYPTFRDVTADFAYVRLHGSPHLYYSDYSDEVLEQWAADVRGWRAGGVSTYVYFDNTALGYAPFNARTLVDLVGAPT